MFHLLFIIPSNTTVSRSSRFGSVHLAACSAVPRGFPFYSTASKVRCTRHYTLVEQVFKKTKVVFTINEKGAASVASPSVQRETSKDVEAYIMALY